ncbi:hypothetical protein OL548_18545 [Lysinibacillus sp. MHQ-1]|nr:hypothetical protein OL548_18545 [Lysinibacillus sp. MHQ-1]
MLFPTQLLVAKKEYGYNKALRQFDVAPALLENGKTYVSVEFVKELMK